MIVKNNDSDDKGPGFLGWFPCCFLKYVYYTASRGDPRRQPIHWKGMNVDINGCPSGLISEVFYDSSSNDNLRLEDRQFTAVSSPSIAGTRPRLGDAEIVQVCTVHTRKNKALSLKSGFDEFFVDASLPAASKLSQKSPPVQRPERRRLLDCDFVEIPAAASHLEVDAILKKPPRSRKGKSDKGQTINEEGENSYRIGQHYQAAVHSHLGDEEQAPTECGIDQLWDPQKAANLPALELEHYLNQSEELSIKMLLLEALHYVNYDLQKATRMFYRIHAQRQGLSVTFSQAECEKFDGLCEGSVIGKRKDFREAARRMNRSVETTLVQYYIWKARNRITYNALKNKRRRDPDECCHCKDGGLLIVCNSCCRAFHLDCLQPQLKKVPDGDWFCSLCTQHSPSRLRRSPQQKSGSIIATRLGFEGELPTENTPKGLLKPHLESKRQQLKAAHKEFSFLARKPPALKHVHVTPTIHSPSAKDPTLEVSPRSVKLYGNLHSDDDDDDEQKIKASPTEIADDLTNEEDDSDSDYKSDEDGADGGVVAETLSKRRQTKVGDSVESAPISIDVILPTCPEGFRIVLRNMNDGLIAVVEYARGPQGEKGYAEACSLIYPGDVITHVDGKPCEKNIHKTLALLRTPCDFGVKVIRITRSGAGPLPPFHLPQSSTIPETGPCFLTFFLPIVPEGFFLQLVETSATFGSICKFGGYKTRNGQTGFAELYNLFRVGDEIVAIDGFNCVGAKLTDVVTMFKKESISGWRAVMIRRWSPSVGGTLKVNEANARVGPTSNEKESSSGLKSASERSVTDLPTANGAKEDWKEDTEHGSMRNSSIPSADPRNGTGGSIIPSFYSYPAHGSGQTNNPLGLQAHSFFPQHAPPFVNGAGINMNFPPSFLPHPSYQSLQPNPANNLASNFQPAWGADLGHSNNANGSS